MELGDFEHETWRGLLGVGVGYSLLLVAITVVIFLLPYLLLVAL